MGRSGAEVGRENVERLRSYLDGAPELPIRGGKLNVQAIADATGIDRQALYRNANCRALIEAAAARVGADAVAKSGPAVLDPEHARLERRVSELERANASLRAEVTELRSRLRRLAHVEEHLTETGRLVR